MVNEFVLLSANFLQSCVPFISVVAYIPQWQKLIKTKSSENISLHSWIMWIISSSIAVYYAIVQYLLTDNGLALIFSAGTNLVFVMITVFFIMLYKKPMSKELT